MSVAPSFSAQPRGTVTRMGGRSAKLLVTSLVLFSALPLSFGLLRLLQLAGLSDVMPPAVVTPLPLVLHIAGALFYSILGALQFSPAVRRRWPSWHRAAGRVSLVGASLVVVSALWLTASYATLTAGGLILAGFRVTVAAGTALSIGLGLAAVLRRDIARHREWMIRAYALGLGSATQMIVLMVAEIATGGPPNDLNRALLMGLAWSLNLAVAEWRIRTTRGAR